MSLNVLVSDRRKRFLETRLEGSKIDGNLHCNTAKDATFNNSFGSVCLSSKATFNSAPGSVCIGGNGETTLSQQNLVVLNGSTMDFEVNPLQPTVSLTGSIVFVPERRAPAPGPIGDVVFIQGFLDLSPGTYDLPSATDVYGEIWNRNGDALQSEPRPVVRIVIRNETGSGGNVNLNLGAGMVPVNGTTDPYVLAPAFTNVIELFFTSNTACDVRVY